MTNTIVTTPVNVTGAQFLNESAPRVEPPKEGKLSNAQAVQVVEAWKHSDFLCHNYVLNGLEIGRSSRIDDKVVQDKRQQDDNVLQDKRQDQPKEEEVEPRRCKRAKTEKLFGPNFVSFNGCKPLGYKWIFKKKMQADSTIDKYKARLAIKGFRQQEGLYYFDTYSTRITLVKMILAIAALRNWKVHQMKKCENDISKHGFRRKHQATNMIPHVGFRNPGLERKLVGFVKSLYSLGKLQNNDINFFDHIM
ncbi:calcineurin B-like protein 4 [Tanacetum coccineum]